MSIESTRRAGRVMAEKLMTARVKVRRYSGDPVIDPVTLQETYPYTVVYGDGDPTRYPNGQPAKITSYEAFEQTPEAGGGATTAVRSRCDFPVGSFEALPGDEVHVISDSADPLLAGKVLRLVVDAPYKSHATAYRIACEEVTDVR